MSAPQDFLDYITQHEKELIERLSKAVAIPVGPRRKASPPTLMG